MTTATDELTLDRAALAYAARGWCVLPVHGVSDGTCDCGQPCSSPGKHPLTPDGLHAATTDQGQIKEWWARWPNANVGVRTGQCSGIMVVDLDIKDADGPGAWAELLDIHGVTDTLTSMTGGGGQHWVYTVPDGTLIKNGVSKLGPGIDVRGEGGYVVVWPSRHVSGYIYEWDHRVTPAPAPAWLIQECAATPKTTTQPESTAYEPWVTEMLRGVPGGARNNSAARLAGYFHAQGIAEDIIMGLLTPFAGACEPPMDLRELRQTVASVARYASQVRESKIVDPPSFTAEADRLIYAWPHHGVTVTIEELNRERDGTHCELTIEALLPGQMPIVHGPVRYNLSSTQTRASLTRYMGGRVELDWGTVLDAVSSLAILHHKRGPAVVNLAHYQGYPPHWYLWPLVLEEEITITFGDGGSCKSLLALGAAVSLAEEQALLSFEPHGQARTLYLDWEASPGAHAERLRRMVHPGPVPDIPYLRCHAPLHEIVRQVRRHLLEQDCKAIVVDSIAAACGGEPERAESALRLCNAVRAIGCTAHLIAHTTKDNDRSHKPFGSTFWHNEARSTVEVSRIQETDSDNVQLGLYHRKINDGALAKPIGLSVTFAPDSIEFNRTGLTHVPELAAKLSTKDHITGYLRQHGASSILQIAAGTERKEDTIVKALQRNPHMFSSITNNGSAHQWDLKLMDTIV